MGIDDKIAKFEQECGAEPICESGDTYKDCACTKEIGFDKGTTCSGGGQLLELDGKCTCVYVGNLQCSSGTLQNCDCKLSDGTTIEPSCPDGSKRPTSHSCYCVALADTDCDYDNAVFSSDHCTCKQYVSYTPSCSNSEVCSFDEKSCSCMA